MELWQSILSNGFLPLVPVLLWNVALMGKLKHDVVISDRGIPRWFLALEHLLRIPVFFYPLLLQTALATGLQTAGLIIYLVSLIIYFISWIPFLIEGQTHWNTSLPGVLAPFLLPLFIFTGIALMCSSWAYFLFSLLFTAVHVVHGSWSWRNAFSDRGVRLPE